MSTSSAGVDGDNTADVQNVINDEMLATKSGEEVKSNIDSASPDPQLMLSSESSTSDDADSVAEAKVDADVKEITDSSLPAAELLTGDSHAVDDRDHSSTEVQHDDSSADSTVTHHERSVLPASVY